MINNEKEIWKALPGVPGVEVSPFGKVRTLDKVTSSENRTWFTKGRVLKQYKNNRGYLQVKIQIDGKWTTKSVHQLVAQTFIQNPNNMLEVNHKDCDKTNNNVGNLEFCTRSYNNKYREKYGISNTESLGHPLFVINLTTLKVSNYPSQSKASIALGINSGSVNAVISGRTKQAHGFWFVNDDENAADAIKRKLQTLQSQAL